MRPLVSDDRQPMTPQRKRICFVCAEPGTFDAFLCGHAARLGRDYAVSLAANGVPRRAGEASVHCHVVGIERQVRPLKDIRALFQLITLFSRERFDVVHSVTPKAGLLAMVASMLTAVPVRIHIFTGQVWATRSGAGRIFLKMLDRLLAACATNLLADSPSQARFLVDQGVADQGRISVIGEGSISGVDTNRFRPSTEVRRAVRVELAVPSDAMVFLFAGRLNDEKGVHELGEAFRRIALANHRAHLWIVGPDEGGTRPRLEGTLIAVQDRVRFVGRTAHPERYMAGADIFCLPSHREGFGSVIIEAAACGCPCIASRIYGITDAVMEGRTGLLHEARNVEELTAVMERVLHDPIIIQTLAAAALQRAQVTFAQERLTEGLADYYRALVCRPPA
jgi:glycosyltransferase involved in cell wall biosynthesis